MHPTKLTIASSICHALDGVQGNFRTGCMRNCHAQKTEPFGPLFPVGSIVCQRPQLLLHEMDCSQHSTTIFLEYKEYLDFHSGSWIQEPHPVALVISHSSHLYQPMYLSKEYELQMANMLMFKALAPYNSRLWIQRIASLQLLHSRTFYTSQKCRSISSLHDHYGITAEYPQPSLIVVLSASRMEPLSLLTQDPKVDITIALHAHLPLMPTLAMPILPSPAIMRVPFAETVLRSSLFQQIQCMRDWGILLHNVLSEPYHAQWDCLKRRGMPNICKNIVRAAAVATSKMSSS
jgi:hypothetical protein